LDDSLLVLSVEFEGLDVKVLIDSGSTDNLISNELNDTCGELLTSGTVRITKRDEIEL